MAGLISSGCPRNIILDTSEPISIDVTNSEQEIAPFEYVRCNIPGPGANLDEFMAQFCGCSCEGDACEPSKCQCLVKYGANYNEDGTILPIHFGGISKPILECNSSCTCSTKCFNRQIQHGIQYPLVICYMGKKGWGLKTEKFIAKNKFVCEYAGEIIDYAEAKRRTKSLKLDDSNYLLVVLEHLSQNKVVKIYVDPRLKGNVGRFINHSCQPNLWMTPIRVNNPVPRICLFALRDIYPDEELTFNYSGEHDSSLPSVISNSVASEGSACRKECFCESPNCVGSLPYCDFLFD